MRDVSRRETHWKRFAFPSPSSPTGEGLDRTVRSRREQAHTLRSVRLSGFPQGGRLGRGLRFTCVLPRLPSVQSFLKYIVSKTRGKCKRILRGGAPLRRRTTIRRSFSCLPRICPFRSAPRTSDTAAFFAHGGAHRRSASFLPFPAAFPAPRSLIFYTDSGRAPRAKRPAAA